MCGRRRRPAEPLAVLPGVGQASPSSFLQNLPFKGGKNSEHGGHGATGRRREVQRLGQRHEADAQVRKLYRAGVSKAEIARRLRIGRTSVRRILATNFKKKYGD